MKPRLEQNGQDGTDEGRDQRDAHRDDEHDEPWKQNNTRGYTLAKEKKSGGYRRTTTPSFSRYPWY